MTSKHERKWESWNKVSTVCQELEIEGYRIAPPEIEETQLFPTPYRTDPHSGIKYPIRLHKVVAARAGQHKQTGSLEGRDHLHAAWFGSSPMLDIRRSLHAHCIKQNKHSSYSTTYERPWKVVKDTCQTRRLGAVKGGDIAQSRAAQRALIAEISAARLQRR